MNPSRRTKPAKSKITWTEFLCGVIIFAFVGFMMISMMKEMGDSKTPSYKIVYPQ